MRWNAVTAWAGLAVAMAALAATLAAAPFDPSTGSGSSRAESTDDPPGAQQPVPKPFPKPNPPQQPATPPPTPEQPQPSGGPPAAPQPGAPTEATLGLPVYPGAEFLASFDAGMGQRYYLFGTNNGFAEIVSYYKAVLKKGGDLVFDTPATHTFEVGRYREETMAFPPGVTVKDYTWNGSAGYLHVKGAKATRYRTIIQLVPVLQGGRESRPLLP
jgi:hypothetical protein